MSRCPRFALVAALVAAACALPAAAHAQQGAYRFEITAAGDSTFSFRVPDAPWVRVGLTGIAVDPMRRDALIARFTVLRVEGSLATAVITGQTAKVNTSYVALLVPPEKKWYAQPAVWIAAGAGILLGTVITR